MVQKREDGLNAASVIDLFHSLDYFPGVLGYFCY